MRIILGSQRMAQINRLIQAATKKVFGLIHRGNIPKSPRKRHQDYQNPRGVYSKNNILSI